MITIENNEAFLIQTTSNDPGCEKEVVIDVIPSRIPPFKNHQKLRHFEDPTYINNKETSPSAWCGPSS